MRRPAWGAAPARGRPRINPEEARGVAVHYSAMNVDEERLHRNCAGRVRAIQRYHMETMGWLDIAYNHVFCRHGYVFVGRGFGARSAANGTKESNDHYFAVCFLGDDTKGRADVTPEARRALAQLIQEYRRRFPKARQVRPHSGFFPTACPGDELRALIKRGRWLELARYS
ncbi:MAG TPA: N-acetylmuramoyl-L-alanine amidase [Gaiellaceae bacterium]|nr:N-acetylmuramoyl-L-alanine amidase [Gaiellaceae bacterium]